MNKFRSLENIIRDVAARTAPISEKVGIMSTIRNIGKKPAESPLANEPKDIDVIDMVASSDVEPEQVSTLKQVLTPGTEEHAAHKEHVKRSLRKLKIIDNP